MEVIRLQLDKRDCAIKIGVNTLPNLGAELAALGARRAVVVTAPPINRRYGAAVRASLRRAGLAADVLSVPDGERAKSLQVASKLYDRFIRIKAERGTVVVALGGGVIGDLAGFIASTYLRGVPFVQVPTTVVAQVDASIGGKTAVNHAKGKNLIGTFYQPALVFIDVALLRTLSRRHVVGGLAEVVKYGVIADAALFDYLERQAAAILERRLDVMAHIVERSAGIKAGVVAQDEREGGLRRTLNYGHTLGHAVETVAGYGRWHHGEAIAMGMQFAALLAERLGLCDGTLVRRQEQLLRRLGLPTALPGRPDTRRLMAAMSHDKKVKDSQLYFVLPVRIGEVRVEPVKERLVGECLAAFAASPLSRR